MRLEETEIYYKKYSKPTASESWYAGMGNNPVNKVDPDGQFGIKVHNEVIIASGRGNLLTATWNFFDNDVLKNSYTRLHFDGYKNYNEVMGVINDAGGFNKLDDHTIGDFYAHSNYVDIWNGLEKAGEVSGTMPTFNDAASNPIFQKALEGQLRTTDFKPWGGTDSPYDHGKGYESITTLQIGLDGNPIPRFGCKDEETEKNKDLFKLAKDAYLRSLLQKTAAEEEEQAKAKEQGS